MTMVYPSGFQAGKQITGKQITGILALSVYIADTWTHLHFVDSKRERSAKKRSVSVEEYRLPVRVSARRLRNSSTVTKTICTPGLSASRRRERGAAGEREERADRACRRSNRVAARGARGRQKIAAGELPAAETSDWRTIACKGCQGAACLIRPKMGSAANGILSKNINTRYSLHPNLPQH